MKNPEQTNLLKTDKGVSVLIFGFTVVALFAFIALAIDSANLFLAWTKMQNIGDSSDMTALNVRIERGPQMRKSDGSLQCPYDSATFIDEACVKNQILPVAGMLLKQNLAILGFDVTGGNLDSNGYTTTAGTEFNAVINYRDCRPGAATCVNPETEENIPVDSNNEFEYFTTTITYDVPLMLMHLVPFGLLGIDVPVSGNSLELKVSSQAVLPALNVAILADISGSMNESVGGGQTKLDFLKTALGSFVNNFRPDRDKISFWPFNLQVSPTLSEPVSATINQGFDLPSVTGKINSLSAAGNTNPTDALLAAYEDFRTRGGTTAGVAGNGNALIAETGIIGNLLSGTKGEYTMVLFSDGAPTAMTAKFAQYDPNNFNAMFEFGMQDATVTQLNDIDNPDYLTGPEIMRAHGPGSCPKGMVVISADHEAGTCDVNCHHDCGTPTPTPTPTATPTLSSSTTTTTVYTWGMPSPFYQTSITKNNSLFGRLFNKTNYDTIDDAQGSREYVNPTTIQKEAQNLNQAYPAEIASPNYLGFKLPPVAIPLPVGIDANSVFANEAAFRDEAQGTNPKIYPTGFKKQFYNNLIAMSDFIRLQMGYIYTVGLGTPATSLTDNDPYQNVNDNFSRKDNLLARVAGDETKNVKEFGFVNPLAGANCTYKPTASASDPVSPDCGLGWRSSPRKGDNINTDSAADLDRIFQRISRQLQTKVVVDPRSRVGGAANH